MSHKWKPVLHPDRQRKNLRDRARVSSSMFPESFQSRAASLIASCRNTGVMIATAESCTGGLLAGLITTIPGSSEVFDRGVVTYSNAAKIECLGVSPKVLETFGAVSQEIALAMAAGALAHSSAD